MEAYQFKINLCLVQESLALKRISIMWGPKAKDTVSFFSCSSNPCLLAPQMMSESLSLRCLSPGGKRPQAPECSGCSLSLGGLRTVTHGVGELQHLITKDVPAVSLKGVRHPPGAWCQRHPFPSSRSRGPRTWQVRMDLDFRDRGIAVSVVDPDMALAPEVGLEDVTIAMVPPPGA